MATKSRLFVRVWLAGLRLISVASVIVGVQLLRMGYPPGGSDAFAPLFLGGVFVLIGVVGIFDPARVTPSGGRDHSD